MKRTLKNSCNVGRTLKLIFKEQPTTNVIRNRWVPHKKHRQHLDNMESKFFPSPDSILALEKLKRPPRIRLHQADKTSDNVSKLKSFYKLDYSQSTIWW